LDELLVDGACLCSESICIQLIWRVADDYVELHYASKQLGNPSLNIVGMNERISVGFHSLAMVKGFLAGATKAAFAISPGMLGALEPDIATITDKVFSDGM
jgi:hypothetical protein